MCQAGLDAELAEGLDDGLAVGIVLGILVDLGADLVMLEDVLGRELVLELLLVQKVGIACNRALQAGHPGHIVHIGSLGLFLRIVGGHILI